MKRFRRMLMDDNVTVEPVMLEFLNKLESYEL